MPTLADLRPGQSGRVEALRGDPALVQRLYELGVLEGDTVEVLGFAPLGDPVEIRVGNTRLSLRKLEAAGITVQPV
jgi:ferrous iron transport protein A